MPSEDGKGDGKGKQTSDCSWWPSETIMRNTFLDPNGAWTDVQESWFLPHMQSITNGTKGAYTASQWRNTIGRSMRMSKKLTANMRKKADDYIVAEYS